MDQDLFLSGRPVFPGRTEDEVSNFKGFQFLPCLPGLIVEDILGEKVVVLSFDESLNLVVVWGGKEEKGDLPFIPAADEVFPEETPRTENLT